MADPKLKPATPAGAPRRVLLNTGAAPTRRVTLLGANGQSIAQKTPTPSAAPATAATSTPAATPQVDEEALRAQQEYERQMEEYNRQMEEYNRQMEEYNRQIEEQEATEYEPLVEIEEPAAAAPEPKSTPAPKLSVARPGGSTTGPKLSVARPGAAPAAGPKLGVARPGAATPKPKATGPAPTATDESAEQAPEMTDAQQQQRQAYLEKLQKMAEKKPFHKRPPFYIGLGILLAIAIGGYFYVSSHNESVKQADQAKKELQALLGRSMKPGATFNDKEIDMLVHIVLNPEERDETGAYLYNSPQGPKKAAQNAAAILGQEAANNKKIYDRVFKLLAKDAVKLDKMMLETILDRLIKSHPAGLNAKLNNLIKELDLSNSKAQDVVKLVFEYKQNLINSKTGKKDLDLTVPMFCNADIKDELRLTIHYYILQIFRDSKLSDAEIQKIGNDIFAKIKSNEKLTKSPYICKVLGASGSDTALAFYKGKMDKKDDWKIYKSFFEEWRNPDLIPYLVDLRESCSAEEEKQAGTMNSIIFGIALAERDMPTDEARKLIRTVYPDYDTDLTPLNALEVKRIDNNGKLESDEQKEWQRLSSALTHRYKMVKHLSTFSEEYQWVNDILAEDKEFISNIPSTDDAPWTARMKEVNTLLNQAPDKIKNNKAEKAKREANIAKTEKKS